MKSFSPRVAVVAALSLVLAGCSAGGDTAGGGNVSLEFQTNLGASDPILEALTKVTDSYQEQHPGVKVELVPSTNTYESDMKVRLGSGDVPDLWATHGWSLLRYSEFLEPLNTQSWAKEFNPALKPAMANEAGEFFALPFDTDVAGIVYNKTVLKDTGIDPAGLGDWSKFNAALGKLKTAGVIPISSSGKDSWFAGNVADFMASGGFAEKELQGFNDGTFQEEGYGKLLDQVASWQKAGYFNPDYTSATTDDLARSMAEGKTAFVMVQNTLVGAALDFNTEAELGYLPIPSDNGPAYLVGGEGRAVGVARDSANKQEALDYVAFLAEPENLSILASAIGGVPGLTNATSDLGSLQQSYDEFAATGEFPLLPYFDRVYLPNGIWDTMVSSTDSVITGQSGVKPAVQQMKTEFEALFAQ